MVKRYNRVNSRYEFVCIQSVIFKEAKWVRKQIRDTLRKDLDKMNNYSG